jgi:hypothetical protein
MQGRFGANWNSTPSNVSLEGDISAGSASPLSLKPPSDFVSSLLAALLLCRKRASWRFRCVLLQRAMHPLMSPVLLWLAWRRMPELGPAKR